jgi:hypothetical protein
VLISTDHRIVPSKVMCSLITPSTTRACVFWRYWRGNSYEYAIENKVRNLVGAAGFFSK